MWKSHFKRSSRGILLSKFMVGWGLTVSVSIGAGLRIRVFSNEYQLLILKIGDKVYEETKKVRKKYDRKSCGYNYIVYTNQYNEYN